MTLIVLLLAVIGFLAYKILFEEKGGRLLKTDVPTDSLKTAAIDPANCSEAAILGFAKGIHYAECVIDDRHGYNYRFNEDGQLYEVYCYNYGTNSTVTMQDGKAVKCEGLEGPAEEVENPPEAEEFSSVYEYRQDGDSTVIYSKSDGQPDVKMGALYYGENGRITKAVNEWKTWEFTYDAEGRAFDKEDGKEVYPPIVLFFAETPTLPKNHKSTKTDSQGRMTEGQTTDGKIRYRLVYYE
ncbi:MAG: hypothetical protein IKX36_10860 [Prevotella sp.]|nr:hypothetical protein [Prevotella sp.]